MEPRWEPGEIVLKFRWGEFVLFRYTLPALVCHENFLEVPPALSLQAPEPELELHGLDAAFVRSCPLSGVLPRLSQAGPFIRYLSTQYRHYYVRRQGSFEHYLAAFNPRTRATILRKVRKFESICGSENGFREHTTPEQIAAFWPLARQISARTFQERMLGQGLPDDSRFRMTIDTLAQANRVRGYLLVAGSRPVSYVFGPIIDNRILLYDYVGYDSAFAKLSPGTVLQYYIIRRIFQEGHVAIYDLCVGEGEHKRVFANGFKECADILYLRANAKTHALVTTHFLLQRLSSLFVTLLDELHCKAAVKKMIRSRFRPNTPT
jgi:CelD/BcsL family acetyltransferase involved in cellulose biosynthesis